MDIQMWNFKGIWIQLMKQKSNLNSLLPNMNSKVKVPSLIIQTYKRVLIKLLVFRVLKIS